MLVDIELVRVTDALEEANPLAQRGDPVGGQACRMDAVPVQGLVDEARRRTAEQEAEDELPILRRPHRLVVGAGGKHRRPPEGGRDAEAALDDCGALVHDLERGVLSEPADDAPLDLEERVGTKDVEIGPRRGESRERLEPFRQVRVVGVEDGEEFPRRTLERSVPRRGHARVRSAEVHDAIAVRPDRRGGVVGRAVVGDDHLDRRPRLTKRGIDRLSDGPGSVVGRDHDRERREVVGPAVRRPRWCAETAVGAHRHAAGSRFTRIMRRRGAR